MESKLPFQNFLACLIPQTFGMFKLGKITFGLGQSSTVCQTTVCKDNRKTDNLTTGLNIKDIL